MAQVKRSDIERDGDPTPQRAAEDRRYDAGGHIAQLQADLAQRLMAQGAAPAAIVADPPGERLVRFLSVAGGYTALLAGYGLVALAIAHWV